MELRVTEGRIGTVDTVFDDVAERPVDCDFLMPDYLPEIAAILKCRMKPTVQTHQISGDRVMADGTVAVQLLYADEERRCVHCYEYTQPFTAAFTVRDIQSGDGVRLSARTNYVNCRAVAPRRVEVHGAFGVRLTVMEERGTEVIAAADGHGLCTRDSEAVCTVPTCCAEKSVTLSEVLELGAESVSAVLRCESSVLVGDVRLMPSKAVVKGEVVLETVCVADPQSGAVQRYSHRLPFSQIVDGEGLAEDSVCDATAAVVQCEVRLLQDPAGVARLLSVSVKLALTLQCYRTETKRMVCDAFHTAYPLTLDTRRFTARRMAFVRTDVLPMSVALATPDSSITELLDMWCEPMTVDCTAEGDNTVLSGQLLVCMLVRDGEGAVAYYERPADISLTAPDSCTAVQATVVPQDITYTHNNGQIELRLQAVVHRQGWNEESYTVVTSIGVNEDAPFAEDGLLSDCSLKICFAPAGESVWELARREHTTPAVLMAENNLSGDVLASDTVLLIPLTK